MQISIHLCTRYSIILPLRIIYILSRAEFFFHVFRSNSLVISSIQYLIVWHILVGSDTFTDNDITINYKTSISGCTPHNVLLSFFCIISTDDDLISMGNTICHIQVFAEAPTMPGDTSAYYANIVTHNVLITSLMVGLIRVENVTGRTVQRLCFMSLHSLTHWVQAWFRWNNCRNRCNHFKKGQECNFDVFLIVIFEKKCRIKNWTTGELKRHDAYTKWVPSTTEPCSFYCIFSWGDFNAYLTACMINWYVDSGK